MTTILLESEILNCMLFFIEWSHYRLRRIKFIQNIEVSIE
jgi:hypothetical protein